MGSPAANQLMGYFEIMKASIIRLILGGGVLFTLFFADVLLSTKETFSFRLVTYIGAVVVFHLIVFESVFMKSKPIFYLVWGVVSVFCITLFMLSNDVWSNMLISGFLIGYVMVLFSFLRSQFDAPN
jgi:hypothetical protein